MMAPGHCNREQKKLGCQTYFWVSSVRTELSRKNRKYFATQTSPRAWQLLSEQQQKNMSDLLFLLLRKACDSSFSKQTLQKCWKESFWSDKDYSSFYKLIIPLCRAWFVSLDLLQAFFFFLSVFLLCHMCLATQEDYLFYETNWKPWSANPIISMKRAGSAVWL